MIYNHFPIFTQIFRSWLVKDLLRWFYCLFSTSPKFWGFFWLFRAAFAPFGVPRIGVELELQLLAYTTAIATWDPSYVCNLHHSSRQRWIPDPLNEARDGNRILMDTSRICFCCATMGTPTHKHFWKHSWEFPLWCSGNESNQEPWGCGFDPWPCSDC